MRVGVLTGGGDCPGLNAVIRAVVRKGVAEYGYEFVGFRDGWRGPIEGETMPLGIPQVRGILPRGGTILGASRTNPLKEEGGPERVAANLASRMRTAAATTLPRFDTGYWSDYSLAGDPSPVDYHVFVVSLLICVLRSASDCWTTRTRLVIATSSTVRSAPASAVSMSPAALAYAFQ